VAGPPPTHTTAALVACSKKDQNCLLRPLLNLHAASCTEATWQACISDGLTCTHHPTHTPHSQELGRIVTITLAGFASSILPRSFEDVMHMIRPSTIPELKPGGWGGMRPNTSSLCTKCTLLACGMSAIRHWVRVHQDLDTCNRSGLLCAIFTPACLACMCRRGCSCPGGAAQGGHVQG
jgi:hypothetical protein